MNFYVAVTKSTSGWRYFHRAGKVQTSSNPQDMRLQRMLGHLSVLIRSDPGDVKVEGKEVSFVYDNGRHYIRNLSKETKFDVITSDPIDPWVKGCAALNTVQYYKMCKEHLKPGGVMTLWMPLYESDEATVKSLQHFPGGFPMGYSSATTWAAWDMMWS